MILAQYTIRSKQDYIYKTNKVVEIMGASENISNAWNVLFEQARKIGLKVLRVDEAPVFCYEVVRKAFENRTLDMVELFVGGGNETVLFRDQAEGEEESPFQRANKAFSHFLLKEFPGMIPMSVSQVVSGDYREDYRLLMQKSDQEKNSMTPGTDQFILPFSLMDRDIFQPLTDLYDGERYSKECLSKRKVGIRCRDADKAIKLLDEMTKDRGNESLLAVIHADGNNMGSKIMELLGDKQDYDSCVNAMRSFTRDTDDAFVTTGLKALDSCRERLMEKYKTNKAYLDKNGNIKEKKFAVRKVLADGDDVTFICNARFAMDYVKAYIEAVSGYKSVEHPGWQYSSCAGICIFHSHYSFAEAYHLSEKACDDGAKSEVHKVEADGRQIPIEEGWVDFHYIHSGIGGNLLSIRDRQGTLEKMARPWCVSSPDKPMSYEKLKKLALILQKYDVSRSDIKNLGIDWEDSEEAGLQSLRRVYGHHVGLEQELSSRLKWTEQQLMKAVYDLAEVYDLWFSED